MFATNRFWTIEKVLSWAYFTPQVLQNREKLCINKNYSIVGSIILRLYEICGGIEIKKNQSEIVEITEYKLNCFSCKMVSGR